MCGYPLSNWNDTREGNVFVGQVVICGETWVHHCIPEDKQANKEWCHQNSFATRRIQNPEVCWQDHGFSLLMLMG
jgi:hypothetical protein